jgi:hypothetical protein
MNGLKVGASAFCLNKFCHFFTKRLEFFGNNLFSIINLTIFAKILGQNPPNLRFKFKKKP